MLLDEIRPILQGVVPSCVKSIGCEDTEELIQDALAIAAQMLHVLEEAGKQVIAKSVAYYTIQRLKCGRRSYGDRRADVYGAGCQLDGRCVVVSFEQSVVMEDGYELTLGESLASRSDDPSMMAGREIDWNELEARLDNRKRGVIAALNAGHGTDIIAKALKVSSPRVTQIKREIGEVITEQWGAAVLQDVNHEPVWAASLRARELLVV
ncbi:MAG: hypothetical protein WCG79_09510 [Verrucomicrobiota bacterium]|jgi:hypothetical protein